MREKMKNEKWFKKDKVMSVIFLIWFFASIIAMWIFSEIDMECIVLIILGQYCLVLVSILVIKSIKNKMKNFNNPEYNDKKQIIKRKPMSSVMVLVNVVFIFVSLFAELFIVFDNEVPQDMKFFSSYLCLPIIIICTILLILDFFLRRKLNVNKMPAEKEEILSTDAWNYYQMTPFVGERKIYSEKLNAILGNKITFIKSTDKYGNVVLKARNDNLFDWIVVFLFSSAMNIIMLIGFFYNETNLISLLCILLICVPLAIYSFLNIKRTKKLKLELKAFQFIKTIIFLILFIIVFGVILFGVTMMK